MVTDRFELLVDLLDVFPGQSILEIGCGRGVFADIICDRLSQGRYVGCDRSAKAVIAARERNQHHVANGLADFVVAPVADLDADRLGAFDTVVAVNVNLFWTGTDAPELAVLHRLLAAKGRLWIAYNYQPVAAAESRRLEATIGARLAGRRLAWELIDPKRVASAFVLAAHRS